MALNSAVTFLGIPNFVDDPTNSLTAGSAMVAVSNLADGRISLPWRSSWASEASTWVRLEIASGNYREIGGFGFFNHNLSTHTLNQDTGALAPLGQFRLRCSSLNFQPRTVPDGNSFVLTNLTGTVAAVQDPDPEHWDATWLIATNKTLNTIVRASFPTLGGGNLRSGAGLQTFRVAVRRTAVAAGSPTVTIDLYENAVFKANLVTALAVGSSLGQVVSATWNASSLSNITGTNVEIRVQGNAQGGDTIEIGAIELVAEFDGTGMTAWHDSGWQNIVIPNATGQSPLGIIYLLSSSCLANYVQLDLKDTGNAKGYLSGGRWVVGPALSTEINVTYGCSWKWEDPSLRSRSLGSALWKDRRTKFRVFEGAWEHLSTAEAYDVMFDKIERRVGTTEPFVLVFQPANSAQYHNTAAYGSLAQLDPVRHDSEDSVGHSIRFEEEAA